MKVKICLFSLLAVAISASTAFSQSDGLIYDNGVAGTVNTGLSSQIDTAYPFDSAVADDFSLGGTGTNGWDVTGISFTGLQFGDPPDLPNPLDFTISFYEDDGSGTGPMGTGPLDAFWSDTINLMAPEGAPGPYSYGGDFNGSVSLDKNTQYWVSIQSINLFPPQFGWEGDNANGGNAVQGFPFLGIEYWALVDPGTEMNFQLYGTKGPGAVPEPTSLGFVMLGGLGLLMRRRRNVR